MFTGARKLNRARKFHKIHEKNQKEKKGTKNAIKASNRKFLFSPNVKMPLKNNHRRGCKLLAFCAVELEDDGQQTGTNCGKTPKNAWVWKRKQSWKIYWKKIWKKLAESQESWCSREIWEKIVENFGEITWLISCR